MVSKSRRLVIDNEAKIQFRKAYEYIKMDSPQNAEKVRSKILSSIKKLVNNPKVHAPDKFRMKNDGSYRGYEIYNYRITYNVSQEEIRVIRIRHSRRNPLEY